MKLCTFARAGALRVGVGVVVATAAANARERLTLASVALAAPIQRPPSFLAIGLNYADHIAESRAETPKLPTQGLAAWGQPVPREFLAPEHIIALAQGVAR